jgi:hypothetical protein
MDEHFDLTHITQQSEKLKETAQRSSVLLAELKKRPKGGTTKRG